LRVGLAAVAVAAVSAVLALGGCANVRYYLDAAGGHLKVMGAAKPVQDWLADDATPQRVKDKLVLSQRIREFAVTELHLPDNPSYHRYADLKRNAVIWNVVAATEYSLELKSWCYMVTGCVGYRGHFDEARARAEAEDLAKQGYETSVYPVPAYSTLGWLNWAGGDPLLNTFIHYPEGELARLIFHELAHQVLYTKNDTMFNESFAVAVERLGGARWLARRSTDQARQEYAEYDARRRQFRALQQRTRERLKAVYDQTELPLERRSEMKKQVMAQFRSEYLQVRSGWPGDPARWRGYDLWVERANNAAFGAQAAYDELVPGFEALFHANGGDFRRFYDAARALSMLPKEERRERLKKQEKAGA
jgi:predicted aminopeptidase